MTTSQKPADSAAAQAPAATFHRFSTQEVAAADRLDYWRSLFQPARIERPSFVSGPDFNSATLASSRVNNVALFAVEDDPLACLFGESDSGKILLGCVRAGAIGYTSRGTLMTKVAPVTGLVLQDSDWPVSTISQRYAMDFLSLPRTLIHETLAAPPVAMHDAVRRLSPVASAHRQS